jgi:hypothetical protein
MPLNPTVVNSLRRVFREGFSVHDIAEPLVSFDSAALAIDVRSIMEENGYEVAGVRDRGIVVGYVDQVDLDNGTCGGFTKSFDEVSVMPDTTPLSEVVLAMKETPRLFISLLGRVGGIVTRSDLQKPPLRMWLFGMVTLIEMRFTRLIEQFCPEDGWTQFLSAGRVQKARDLLAERTRRNQHIDLLDCLQFSDKGQIVARSERLRRLTKFESRRQIEQTFKALERLRNNLAHSQDIITSDWEIIVQLSENLDRVLEGPPGLRDSHST